MELVPIEARRIDFKFFTQDVLYARDVGFDKIGEKATATLSFILVPSQIAHKSDQQSKPPRFLERAGAEDIIDNVD